MSSLHFAPDEIRTDQPTRSTRLKWVVLVDGDAPLGQRFNAVACVAASTAHSIQGLIGPPGSDEAGSPHAGLPWSGCTLLDATAAELIDIRQKAAAHGGMFVADMPESAQTNRVYDDYLAELGRTMQPPLVAVSIVGPRNAVDRLVKRLALIG